MTRLRLLFSHAPWLAASCIALVCVASSRADDKSDLVGRIEDKLEDAADALERLPDHSGDSAIERARSYVAEARRYADDLGRIAGDDSSARRIAEDFDDIQDDFNDAAQQLRQMKAGMRRAEPVAARCAERDRELTRAARDYEARNDPDGLSELRSWPSPSRRKPGERSTSCARTMTGWMTGPMLPTTFAATARGASWCRRSHRRRAAPPSCGARVRKPQNARARTWPVVSSTRM
jgi:hypothetical protein